MGYDAHIEYLYREGEAGALSGPYGARQTPSLIIIHSTRGGTGDTGLELKATLSYFHSGKAGAHCIVAAYGDRYWIVPLQWQAWGASYLNPRAFHIELIQPSITDEFTEAQYEGAVEAVKLIRQSYDIPLVHVIHEKDEGIIGHEDTFQGWNKSDPGSHWDWEKFMEMLEGGRMRNIPLILDDLWKEAQKVEPLFPKEAKRIEQLIVEIKSHIYRDETQP